MYSPETLLQVHHQRHAELTAAVRRPDAAPRAALTRPATGRLLVAVARTRQAAVTTRYAVGDAVARTASAVRPADRPGATAVAPVCCPA